MNEQCFWGLGTLKRISIMVPGLSLVMRPTVIASFSYGNSLKERAYKALINFVKQFDPDSANEYTGIKKKLYEV